MVEETSKEELQILDMDNYRGDKPQTYNHQQLIMKAMNKVLEAGAKELREGWWEEKMDRNGNLLKTYNTDTRKEFISSVKTLLMLMERDYDDEAIKNLNKLFILLNSKKKYWLEQEWLWWTSLNPSQQSQLAKEGKAVSKGFFNQKLNFDNMYFEEEVEIYREIATEINKLIKRLGDYEEIEWEN